MRQFFFVRKQKKKKKKKRKFVDSAPKKKERETFKDCRDGKASHIVRINYSPCFYEDVIT